MTVFSFFVLFYNNNKIENDDSMNFILFESRSEELIEFNYPCFINPCFVVCCLLQSMFYHMP